MMRFPSTANGVECSGRRLYIWCLYQWTEGKREWKKRKKKNSSFIRLFQLAYVHVHVVKTNMAQFVNRATCIQWMWMKWWKTTTKKINTWKASTTLWLKGGIDMVWLSSHFQFVPRTPIYVIQSRSITKLSFVVFFFFLFWLIFLLSKSQILNFLELNCRN